jgi:hypothetical protein
MSAITLGRPGTAPAGRIPEGTTGIVLDDITAALFDLDARAVPAADMTGSNTTTECTDNGCSSTCPSVGCSSGCSSGCSED